MLLIGQQVGWMVYSQRLVNKSMSGTYQGFVHAEKSVKAPTPKFSGIPGMEGPMIAMNLGKENEPPSQADELNSLLNL